MKSCYSASGAALRVRRGGRLAASAGAPFRRYHYYNIYIYIYIYYQILLSTILLVPVLRQLLIITTGGRAET